MIAQESNLQSQVETLIASNPYLARRKLRFHAEEGRVTLSGRVDSYFEKQMAQEALRTLAGVYRIDNRLEVDWAGCPTSPACEFAEP